MTTIRFKHGKENFSLSFYSESDHLFKVVQRTGDFYEVEALKYIRSMGINGDFVVDVGANVGNHAVFFANYTAKEVICIEANSQLIPILNSNIKSNPGQYRVISKGLGASIGTARLFYPLKDNVGAGKLEVGKGEVELTTLDEVAPAAGVALVKIDVEGMELDVLRGANLLLKSQHPHLMVEAPTDADFQAINRFLLPYGYKALTKWNATATYHFAYNPHFFTILYSRFLHRMSKLKRLTRRR